MRNEREIIEKILDAARQDDSVRVVIRTDLVPKRKYEFSANRDDKIRYGRFPSSSSPVSRTKEPL